MEHESLPRNVPNNWSPYGVICRANPENKGWRLGINASKWLTRFKCFVVFASHGRDEGVYQCQCR
jgi:hypothetical protein